MTSSGMSSILLTSCEVRNPSKKWRNGTRLRNEAACAMSAKSCASCTLALPSKAKPVVRAAITSWWSPKMERPCAARERAATWNTAEVSSPAILYIFGNMSIRPCEAVKVVVRLPACNAPCTVPAAPPSLCISITSGIFPQIFFMPFAAHSSASSAILLLGVMG